MRNSNFHAMLLLFDNYRATLYIWDVKLSVRCSTHPRFLLSVSDEEARCNSSNFEFCHDGYETWETCITSLGASDEQILATCSLWSLRDVSSRRTRETHLRHFRWRTARKILLAIAERNTRWLIDAALVVSQFSNDGCDSRSIECEQLHSVRPIIRSDFQRL